MQHDLSMLDVTKKTTKHVRLRPRVTESSKHDGNEDDTMSSVTASNASSNNMAIKNETITSVKPESKEKESKANDLNGSGDKGFAMKKLLVRALYIPVLPLTWSSHRDVTSKHICPRAYGNKRVHKNSYAYNISRISARLTAI